MALNKESMKATLRDLLHQRPWYGLVQIHARRILVAAPELSDVFRDHLKEREAICRRELKEIAYMRDHFESASHAMISTRLKLKHTEGKLMNIQPADVRGSHRTGSLSSITAQEITALLGFKPNVDDDPDKVVNSWGALIDGDEVAIWDYKGSHKYGEFSTYGSGVALAAVFGDRYQAG